MVFSNKDKYTGIFENGLFNGVGVFTWVNGDSFSGVFKDGEISGAGEITIDGKSYKGQMVDGKFKCE